MRHTLPLLPALLLLTAFTPAADDPIAWTAAQKLGIEGQGFTDLKAPFDRLPAKAEKTVRPAVWNLSRHSAGLCVRFRSNADTIHARWTLTNKNLVMNHMPATGVSGLDLYARDKAGKWRWLGVGRPSDVTNTTVLAKGLPADGMRDFILYLPLYNGVSSVEIGVPKTAKLEKAAPHPPYKKPIVFYGTSITQGGCASRPGMVHTAILGRRFDWPVINLGFSGNGKMEDELAHLLAEIDAGIYVLDCLPNLSPAEVAKRTRPVVEILRKKRPDTPIILVEDRTYTNATLLPAVKERNLASRAALEKVFKEMIYDGIPSLHYQPGDKLMGDDDEGTVDSSHPTDLGFLRQAEVMQPLIRFVLPTPTPARAAIEGYTDQLSYQPGDTVKFHISSKPEKFSLEIARVGAERKVVWTKADIAGKEQAIPANASSHGCGWPESLSVKIPVDWKSGYYSGRLTAKLDTGKTATSELFFVVRSANPGKASKILLQLSTNTYNAYCNWGGYSLYAYNGKNRVQGRRVSFDRPLAGQFRNWELPFVAWAEKAGYEIDYAVNSDLEARPEILKNYKLVLSVGHDEYWSAPMRDNLEAYIGKGGNVAFFSGNTCCWQVRSEEKARALACFKQAYRADPLYAKGERKILSTLWSHQLIARPENALTGVGFLWGGYHRSHGQLMDKSGAFNVHQPDHWLFEGTKTKVGDEFGGKDTIVGYECDGCELTWRDGIPTPTYRDGTPKGFTVVATAPARWHPDDCEWYEGWQKGRTGNAVMGTYTRGGTVVTVGTTDWAHGLRGKDPVVARVTRNVLDRLGK